MPSLACCESAKTGPDRDSTQSQERGALRIPIPIVHGPVSQFGAAIRHPADQTDRDSTTATIPCDRAS